MLDKEILRLADVAEYLGVSEQRARAYAKTPGFPLIPRIKGGTYLIPRDAFIEWAQTSVSPQKKRRS